VAFQILKEKCAETVEMFGWDFLEPVRLYSDASKYAAGCAITQKRMLDGKLVEVPILYDSFTFSKAQRNYGTYKKELCAIVEFARKYDHMLRAPKPSVILTDHKPLTYFLQSSALDGIYARWACELRCLNIEITWIPGVRNPVADALSRTIYPEPGTPDLVEFGDLVFDEKDEPKWQWKDGKDGYAELLRSIGEPLRDEELRKLMLGDAGSRPSAKLASFGAHLKLLGETVPDLVASNLLNAMAEIPAGVQPLSLVAYLNGPSHSRDSLPSRLGESDAPIHTPPHSRYLTLEWYADVVLYLTIGAIPGSCKTKIQQTAFLRKTERYSTISGGDLYIELRGVSKRCVTEDEVSQVLLEAHDNGGHFAQQITLRRLTGYYWPGMAKDAREYILGCLTCARFGTARRSQTAARVEVSEPMELLGIDFCGPFPRLDGVSEYYILVVVDYFSRYVWAEATVTDDSESVISFLTRIFAVYGTPAGIYADPGPHFGEETRTFAESRGVVWATSPVAAKRASGMVEKAVDILQRILKKISRDPKTWP
jgi:hypothetical protein